MYFFNLVNAVHLSLTLGASALLTSGLPEALNDSSATKAVAQDTIIAIAPVTTPHTAEPKPIDDKATQEATAPAPQLTPIESAPVWSEFVKSCETLDATIVTALTKRQMKEGTATEFRANLAKIRAHLLAVKPKLNGKDVGFSQKLVIARDLGDLKAEVDYTIASIMHPHENVETVKKKFLAELDEALKAKKIAEADVEKLSAEVKQQEDLMKSMHRGKENLAAKDQELIADNFADLHVALQRRIQFSQESVPLIDAERKNVEEMLKNASTANTLDAEKCKKFNETLAKIATKESESIAKGPLSSSQIVAIAMELEGLDEIVQSQISAAPTAPPAQAETPSENKAASESVPQDSK